MKTFTSTFVLLVALCASLEGSEKASAKKFSPERDLLSLHYDHAPDMDDGHSAAADRTILESMFGTDWIKTHVVAVSGTYGTNARQFNAKSNAVMDVAWNDCGGWLAGHANSERVVAELLRRWTAVLTAGGDVWVKEGGQSDFTAEVVRRMKVQSPDLDTTQRVHVVQHSDWNEHHTTSAALAYAKKHTHYVRIRDANAYLNIAGGSSAFVKAAVTHPKFARVWSAAFTYYNPSVRLDFSDTGELMHILGLGEMDIDEFRRRFLSDKDTRPIIKPEPNNG